MNKYADGDVSKSNDEICTGCRQETLSCRCQYLTENVDRINEMLLEMELLDRIAGQSMTNLVQKLIKKHIDNVCHGIFDKSHLKSLESVSQSGIWESVEKKLLTDETKLRTRFGLGLK